MDALLWRRLYPGWWILDKRTGLYRLSSAAFFDSPNADPMSVILAAESPGQAAVLADYPGYGLAQFTARIAREECYTSVARTPTVNEPWHVSVIGDKTDAVRDHFKRRCTIVVEPTPLTGPKSLP